MTIFIGTTQPDVLRFLAFRLEAKGHSCTIFTSQFSLDKTLNTLQFLPDLLILDYKLENHLLAGNPFESLYKKRRYLPMIYYNDPCIGEGARMMVWRGFIEDMENPEFIPAEKTDMPSLDDLDKIFRIVNDFVESDDFSPYIHLMQRPKPFPKKYTFEYISEKFKAWKIESNSIQDFRKKSGIPENLFILLQIFSDRKGTSLSIAELQKFYSEQKAEISENSLKVLISNLRSYFKKFPEYRFAIVKTASGYEFQILE